MILSSIISSIFWFCLVFKYQDVLNCINYSHKCSCSSCFLLPFFRGDVAPALLVPGHSIIHTCQKITNSIWKTILYVVSCGKNWFSCYCDNYINTKTHNILLLITAVNVNICVCKLGWTIINYKPTIRRVEF